MARSPHILIVDDERSIRLLLETGLGLNGFQVAVASSSEEALGSAAVRKPDVVLTDIFMPGSGGFGLIRELRSRYPSLPVILMTAQGSVETAVEAVGVGATDFIAKPFDVADVVSLIRRRLEASRELDEAAAEHANRLHDFSTSGLIGRSAPMVMVYKLIAHAAKADVTVLLTGESGTGKELVAQSVHANSARANRPFLSVNCSGLTETLLEAELFGYTRGSFTGAIGDRAGLFESAHQGTLFLDELASTSPAFQASLLRVLQSGEIRRVGSTQVKRVDVRVIAASNVPLRQLVAEGRFRSDLYYRLSVLSIPLPPLREREGDVPLLITHFLHQLSPQGGPPCYLTREALAVLRAYPFPGNVRELENALRRAVALASGGVITLDCLPPDVIETASSAKGTGMMGDRSLLRDRPTMEELERRYLQLILEETGWNRRRAAGVLGLDRRTVQRLIVRYQLKPSCTSALDSDEEDGDDDAEATERQSNSA